MQDIEVTSAKVAVNEDESSLQLSNNVSFNMLIYLIMKGVKIIPWSIPYVRSIGEVHLRY